MAKTLDQAGKEVSVAKVVQYGEQITIPEKMTIPKAIEVLKSRYEYLQTEMVVSEEFDVFPWEGGLALMKALQRKYGWAQAVPIPGFFGATPPQMVTIDVSPTEKIDIPWGRFAIPGVKGYLQTGTTQIKGRVGFQLTAKILRNDEEVVKQIAADIRHILATESLYAGQAIKIKFYADDGDQLGIPELTFIDTSGIKPEQLILSDDVLDSVETNLFTPITRVPDLRANGIPIKRGILLGGTYGTGKTLAASVASRLAVESGVMFLYVGKADELAEAVKFAQRYVKEPAVVIFCEDVDRETDGDRSVELDELLNIIDGLDTKRSNIIVVLTTNNIDSIHPAMMRPGRLDAVIDVAAPDAAAVEKLLRFYGGDKIAAGTNLEKVGTVLAGCIPAVIAEVVKRAKLAELKRCNEGGKMKMLSEASLLESAKTMKRQLDLLNKDRTLPTEPSFKQAIADAVVHAFNGGGGLTNKLTDAVADEVQNRM
jgi:transitional endoplasmic reticulum ATPase